MSLVLKNKDWAAVVLLVVFVLLVVAVLVGVGAEFQPRVWPNIW